MQQASGDRTIHLQPDLGDRFQGALLGLALAPAAAFSERVEAIAPSRQSALLRLHQTIDDSFAQTIAFVSAPNTWRIDPAKLQDSASLLPLCLPILLRYHHSWEKRLNRLSPLQSQVNIAQALVLGDLLEAMNTDVMKAGAARRSALSWTAWLTQSAMRYRDVPAVGDQYEAALSTLSTVLSAEMNGFTGNGTVLDEGVSGKDVHQSFAMGVSIAIVHPESYVLALRRLFGHASIRTVKRSQTAESAWVAAYVAGLLSGAWQGGSRLPTLWQVSLEADSRLRLASNLADDLFCLWSGQPLGRGVY